jgi:hypothetical protein
VIVFNMVCMELIHLRDYTFDNKAHCELCVNNHAMRNFIFLKKGS